MIEIEIKQALKFLNETNGKIKQTLNLPTTLGAYQEGL